MLRFTTRTNLGCTCGSIPVPPRHHYSQKGYECRQKQFNPDDHQGSFQAFGIIVGLCIVSELPAPYEEFPGGKDGKQSNQYKEGDLDMEQAIAQIVFRSFTEKKESEKSCRQDYNRSDGIGSDQPVPA